MLTLFQPGNFTGWRSEGVNHIILQCPKKIKTFTISKHSATQQATIRPAYQWSFIEIQIFLYASQNGWFFYLSTLSTRTCQPVKCEWPSCGQKRTVGTWFLSRYSLYMMPRIKARINISSPTPRKSQRWPVSVNTPQPLCLKSKKTTVLILFTSKHHSTHYNDHRTESLWIC